MPGVKSQGKVICPDVSGVRGVESSGQDPKTYVLIPAPILMDASVAVSLHARKREGAVQTCAKFSSVVG